MHAHVIISAADVARLLEAMGIDTVIAVDLRCGQIQGFFGTYVPVQKLDSGVTRVDYFGSKDLHNPLVISLNAGGVYCAKKFKERLENKYEMEAGLAMIIKQKSQAGSIKQLNLVRNVTDAD